MARQRLWFDYHGGRSLLPESSLREALRQAGVEARPRRESGKSGDPGLVCFRRVDDSLLALIREASGADRRLLAIAAPGTVRLGRAAWRLLAAGAADVFAWDAVPEPAGLVAVRLERWREVDRLVRSSAVADGVVGESPALRAALRQVVDVARFTRSPVLVTGESGTGKELVARLVHRLGATDGARPGGELIVLDCTTVVPELSGSEFFGHERGAFTHAVSARDGAFALADGGTLFIDEIGELPRRLQAELLRVVQEKTYKRVGGSRWLSTDFRLVCATNRDLAAEMASGRFRRDLFYRLAVWHCHLPPLQARPEDVPALVRHFLAAELGKRSAEVDPLLMDVLVARDYPGNVRELKQLVGRMAARHVGEGPVTLGDLPEEERPCAATDGAPAWPDAALRRSLRRALARGVGLKEIGNAAADLAVELAVGDADGNLQVAAVRLGVTDRALQMRRKCKEEAD